MAKKPKSKTEGELTLPAELMGRPCASSHFGAWAIEPKWFMAAMEAVRSGAMVPKAGYDDEDGEGEDPAYAVRDGVAIIMIDGQMTKRGSSFGGCSTVRVRKALREARSDFMVKSVLLHICSPGGTVAGAADLADDVLMVREIKPVHAYIADMGCSAAYWVASQCETISANKTALVGNIGAYAVLEDSTKAQEQHGIRWRVVSTGEYKGLGADGAVSDKLVADVQREVDELNAPFLAAVAAGRAGKIRDMATVADGRAHVAEQAKQLGLVDSIVSLDTAIEAISKRSPTMTPTEQVKQIAAEHPESVASYIEQGKKAGMAEGRKEIVDLLKSNAEAAKGNHDLAIKSTIAGHGPEVVALAVETAAKTEAEAKARDDAHKAALAAKDQEIERLKFESQGQGAIGTAGAKKEEAAADTSDPKAAAKAEWDAMDAGARANFVSEDIFVRARARELSRGQ